MQFLYNMQSVLSECSIFGGRDRHSLCTNTLNEYMFMQAHRWFFGFPDKESACNVVDLGSIPRLGRSLGGGNGYQFQYSGLENSTDSIVHGVAKGRTRLRNLNLHFQPHLWSKQSREWRLSTLFGTALLLIYIYIFLKEGCCIILRGKKIELISLLTKVDHVERSCI